MIWEGHQAFIVLI